MISAQAKKTHVWGEYAGKGKLANTIVIVSDDTEHTQSHGSSKAVQGHACYPAGITISSLSITSHNISFEKGLFTHLFQHEGIANATPLLKPLRQRIAVKTKLAGNH